ncbi:cysteine hydrolase [Aeromicrobium phragmitis]|uniref:Cysteine hydrolase n=1 Tax=Aeromicrobium phragmitis TaxID=2478914 RepID=A0A3L8PM12_9ACTN|nr:isochorismatase family cysteine hydrolase [Aeromicrobium phragmitis]RLV56264.1 cysteine hydrolase [Aeromicrobium phragmitis]
MAPDRALLLIDLQEQFFDPPGLQKVRGDLVTAVQRLLTAARQAGAPMINVRTVHRRDRSTWALNMLEDDQPMVLEGSPGAAPLVELDLAGAHEVLKTRDDAFFATELDALLERLGTRELVLTGVETEACIALTASSAYARDLRVHLATDAIASADEEQHRRTLELLHAQYRQPLVAADDIRFD